MSARTANESFDTAIGLHGAHNERALRPVHDEGCVYVLLYVNVQLLVTDLFEMSSFTDRANRSDRDYPEANGANTERAQYSRLQLLVSGL